jgi:2-amino-4-hydroxy-6-hydroxymethyldihydropteridine diphosphokinase
VEGAHRLRAWLGLGTNLGDRMANLRAGCEALERDGVQIRARSHVYETEAMEGATGQQDFLNACIAVETSQDPQQLLATAKRIELELGRDPEAPRHSPRPLDIDILLTDASVTEGPDPLVVPHPGITERRFVLEPLLELDPPDRERLEDALGAVQVQRVAQLPIIL